MCSVRIGQITRNENQRGPVLLEKLESDANVLGSDWILPDLSCLIERQVKEARLVAIHSERLDTGDGLRFANSALDILYFLDVDLSRHLCLEERFDSVDELAGFRVALREVAVEPAKEVDIAADLVIEDRNVAGRLVRHDDVVVVLVQLVEDAAHGDHVVVRVRREHDDVAVRWQLALASHLRDQGIEHFTVERSRLLILGEQ